MRICIFLIRTLCSIVAEAPKHVSFSGSAILRIRDLLRILNCSYTSFTLIQRYLALFYDVASLKSLPLQNLHCCRVFGTQSFLDWQLSIHQQQCNAQQRASKRQIEIHFWKVEKWRYILGKWTNGDTFFNKWTNGDTYMGVEKWTYIYGSGDRAQ